MATAGGQNIGGGSLGLSGLSGGTLGETLRLWRCQRRTPSACVELKTVVRNLNQNRARAHARAHTHTHTHTSTSHVKAPKRRLETLPDECLGRLDTSAANERSNLLGGSPKVESRGFRGEVSGGYQTFWGARLLMPCRCWQRVLGNLEATELSGDGSR